MISKEKKNTLHIASCSFGKDSLATILLALEHGEPLDEAVYCEVMFDKRISGEVPEHRAFIYETAIPRLERLGVPVRVLRSDKTYLDLFAGTVTRGPKKGLRRGFPLCGHCYVQRDCKLRPIRRYWRLCRRAIPPPASKSQTPMRSWHGNVFGRNWRAPPEPALCGNSTCYAPLVAFFVEEQTSYYQQVEGFVLPFDAARTTARNSRQKTEEIER